jgi:quercetin dioxygenase-like cupin family protein
MDFINKLEKAKILKRNQLLPILKGQILSTQLSDNEVVSIELFSLAKEEEISSHNLLEQTLYVVLSGVLDISGKKIEKMCYYLAQVESASELKAMENTLVLIYTFKGNSKIRNLNFSKVTSLGSQIDIVKKAVSSKIIIQEEGLSMTLFSLAEKEGLNTHKASGDALVIPLEGTVDIKIAEDQYSISEGDCIILPYGIAHSLLATKPYKMLLTVINK